MSTVFRNLGIKVAEATQAMADGRETAVKNAVVANDSAISSLNSTMEGNFDDLSDDAAKAKADKLAALATSKASLQAGIAALVTNATEDVDAIGDVIAFLNDNNADWIATLASKKAELEAELKKNSDDNGDYDSFADVWSA